MSNKQIVQDLLDRLPSEVTLHEIAREIELIAAVRQGLDDLEQGRSIPLDDVEKELPTWVIN